MRLRRRFRTWLAPGVALVVFAAMFTFSSLVLAPAITGSGNGSTPTRTPAPGIGQPGGHAGHHSK